MIKTFEEFEDQFHIIILFDKSDKVDLNILTEGQWVPSEVSGYWQRLDTPKFDFQQLHVHIAKQKNINTKTKQVSWNHDTSRHDRKTFNNNFIGMETAKKIAIKALGLPEGTILENINNIKGSLLLESVEYLPSYTNVFIFQVK